MRTSTGVDSREESLKILTEIYQYETAFCLKKAATEFLETKSMVVCQSWLNLIVIFATRC